MCRNCQNASGLSSTAHGSTFVTSPSTRSKPTGAFIQALTAITQNVPTTPVTAIGSTISRCFLGGIRSQP